MGINRLLARLRHVFSFSWAIEQGYVNETPFKRARQTVIKLATRVETPRQRRLVDDEEQRLLAHAGWHLRGLIIAALGTGCRIGELLTLQGRQVRCDSVGQPTLIDLAAEHTKTNEHRSIPIGQRLRAVLELRRMDPQGVPLSSEAYVFGTEAGERVRSVKTAWRATCRRAGIADLHFHDLRREFTCRLIESSAELHDVRDFLGHANITTTSRYLRSAPVRLVEALQRMEASATEPDDADERLQRVAVR